MAKRLLAVGLHGLGRRADKARGGAGRMTGWLGVVSHAHVLGGRADGIAQLCHGKAQPLRRMHRGDWIVYYSPTEELGGEPLRSFTAIGQILDDEVFSCDTGGGFIPFRRRVRYADAHEVPLEAIRGRLELCASPSWGVMLRRGHLPLAPRDLELIAAAMGVPGDVLRKVEQT